MATDAEKLGLPIKPFFYYLDQVQTLLSFDPQTLEKNLFYLGRSVGMPPRDKIKVTNLAPEGETPEWRVLEKHLIQYLKFKGIRFYTPGFQ